MIKKKALFVGLCTKDILYYTDNIPAKNHKSKTEDFATYIGGPAANAAITYAALGGDATLATCLGDGMESRAMLEKLKEYDVKVLNYAVYETIPNTACIVVSGNGDRTIISGQHPFEVNCDYDLKDYDFALFDCNQQEISLDILQRMTKQTVVLDAGNIKPNIERFLERADIILASEDFRDEAGSDIFGMQCKADQRVMTRGGKSILYNGTEIPVNKVKAVDTLGAGDIFHGAFCYSYFEGGKRMEDALCFAAKIAGKSIKYRGPRKWIKSI